MNNFAAHINYKLDIYHKAMAATGYAQAIIAAGAQQLRFRDDLPVPFTANAYFREWLPLLQHPDCFLLIGRELDKPVLFLKVVADYWHSAPEPLAAEISAQVEVVEYGVPEDLAGRLPQVENTAFIGSPDARPGLLAQAEINPEHLLNNIDYQRAWKSDYEMDNMREANRSAIRGHLAAEAAFREGLSEYEIHMAYLSAVGCLEQELPYPNIIALNEHAAVLHHMVLAQQRPGQSRSLLIDAGAPCNGYGSDITRTYIGEGGDELFTALLAGTEKLQQELVAGLKPGVGYAALHAEAHEKIAELLAELSIIRVSPEEAVAGGLSSAFFPHGLGHLIGAQVHDKGGYLASAAGEQKPPPEQHPFLRCTRRVEAGMSFTVEPGIYFIPMLLEQWRGKGDAVNWALVEQLLPYGGIRIEDNVIVHQDRVENMTRDAFSAQGCQ